MRRIATLFLSVLFAAQAWAQRFQSDDLYYNITSDSTVEVVYSSRGSDNYSNITAAVIPDTVEYGAVKYAVKSIGQEAFGYCRSLTSISIPNTVDSICSGAFFGCGGQLTKTEFVSIESLCRIKFVDAQSNPLKIAKHLYIDDVEITELEIPNTVTSISDYTFYLCRGLTSVVIPNSVTEIGDWAFSYCSGLTSIDIANSVTTIGGGAFTGCNSLTSITIPNSVDSIGGSAFSMCEGLESITIPNSVRIIEGGAFYGCSNLASVTIPNSVKNIGENAFFKCNNLTSVTIDSDADVSNAGLMFQKDDIRYKVLSKNTVLLNYVLNGPNDFVIPETVEAGSTFTVVGIEDAISFPLISNLTSLTIPKSITNIYNNAFSSCKGLTWIIYEGTSEPSIGNNAFNGVDLSITVCVPENYESNSFGPFSKLHDTVIDPAVAATATETGLTEGAHCSKCGRVLVAQEVISVLGGQGGNENQGGNNEGGNENQGGNNEGGNNEGGNENRGGNNEGGNNEGGNENNPATAVAESAANTVNIYAHGDKIVVENATDEIRVYNAMGKLVCRDTINRVRATISVNTTGVYIVKTGNVVKRVMVNR